MSTIEAICIALFVTVSDNLMRMRSTLLPSRRLWTSLFFGLCCLTWMAKQATAQLWDVPPLPPVKYAQAQDGIRATIGNESVHISVCHPSVIHFVSTPEPPTTRQIKPWMLDSKESCPGAKFKVSETTDAAVLTTDTLKIELSLKWGNVQFSTEGGENLLRERNSIPAPTNLLN